MISYKTIKLHRVLCVACAVSVAFISLFCSCVTVSAKTNPFIPNILDPNFDYDTVVGYIPITTEEAMQAAFDIYGKQTGLSENDMRGMLYFALERDKNRVAVYSSDYTDEVFDFIYYLNDTDIYSIMFDSVIEVSEDILTIRHINNGVDNGFLIMTKAFNFLIVNPLCSFILGLSFTFAAFRLMRYGIKSVKSM
ncbi:MAG: hypothetical protein ACI4KA_00115 [Oscillospiraceae bacterium]